MVPLCILLSSLIVRRVSAELMLVEIGKNGTTMLNCLSSRHIFPPSFSMNSSLLVGLLSHVATSALVSSSTIPWLWSLKIECSFRGGVESVFIDSSALWKVLANSSLVASGLKRGWSLSGSMSSCRCLMAERPLAWSRPGGTVLVVGVVGHCSLATTSRKDCGWGGWVGRVAGDCVFMVSIAVWMELMLSEMEWIRASKIIRSVGASICGTFLSVIFISSCWVDHWSIAVSSFSVIVLSSSL